MSERNTVIRSMHDLGLAAWFGGSLMGATGLNGGTSNAKDPQERLKLSAEGWAIWTPWQVGAVATHAVGGLGLILANRARLSSQKGATASTVVKGVLTLAAAGVTAYSGVVGKKVQELQREGGKGATQPAAGASDELTAAQQQLKVLQWAIPGLTAALIAIGAQQGEQQRGVPGALDQLR